VGEHERCREIATKSAEAIEVSLGPRALQAQARHETYDRPTMIAIRSLAAKATGSLAAPAPDLHSSLANLVEAWASSLIGSTGRGREEVAVRARESENGRSRIGRAGRQGAP
jgi:hypothetical protein